MKAIEKSWGDVAFDVRQSVVDEMDNHEDGRGNGAYGNETNTAICAMNGLAAQQHCPAGFAKLANADVLIADGAWGGAAAAALAELVSLSLDEFDPDAPADDDDDDNDDDDDGDKDT
ncbi:hypothetical protein CL628_04235 [bacterium]|nr:hypothetical protein [bacterium]